ncbi:MAG: exodeoxyribonuclease VII large subunit, partial [Alphaproteobacteria bacterium]
LYFNLKDQNALINAVCFRNYTKNINFEIGDGLKISAFGKISTFEGRSNYQINIEKMEIAGIGAILEMLEKRKKKLTEEGLFEQIHKKPIPFFPKIIGVITSETGAVIQDIIHRITDRSPLHLLLYPSAVQGEKAPKEVIAGIKYFNSLKNQKPEVIIIARGGGSFEDLMPFNDEELVREVFKSSIPIISAIGHETDFTILDFVADLRAPTPTASAEFVTPVLNDLKLKIKNITNNLKNLQENSLINKHNLINNLSKNIINFDKIIENKSNQTNIFFDKIYFQLNNFLNLNFSNLKILENKIITPEKLFQNLDLTVINHHNKILNYSQNIFNEKNLKLKKITLNNHNLINKIAIISQKIKFDFDNLKNKI